ncbi:hypothetical protein DICPUDRAFT_71595, partial [Dictyostelium purpureum]
VSHGPWTLKPTESKSDIPSSPESQTLVKIEADGEGFFKISSAATEEETHMFKNSTEFSRDFGGCKITIRNVGGTTITISTTFR